MYLTENGPLTSLEAAVDATSEAVGRLTSSDVNQSDSVPDASTEYAAEVAWSLIYGQLRGRVPYPVPFDLLGVAVSLALRWNNYVGSVEQVKISGDQVTGFQPPQFTGFLLSELIVLWRYRVRTG
jgi:hypothetical protein